MEMIVAIFVFSLVMTTVTATFVSVINSRKKVKAIQQDMEDARYAMELMAKSLRTSSVTSSDSADIRIYDYSQGKCIEYKFDSASNKLQSGSGTPTDPDDAIGTCNYGTLSNLTNGNISDVHFVAAKSVGGAKVGKVTIALKVCYNDICSGSGGDTAMIQTTVSLRDYQEVNPN